MQQDEWKNYRLLVMTLLENLKNDYEKITKRLDIQAKEIVNLKMRLNDQKWINRILAVGAGLAGGAGSNLILKLGLTPDFK